MWVRGSRAGPHKTPQSTDAKASTGRWWGSKACCLASSVPPLAGTGPTPHPGADRPCGWRQLLQPRSRLPQLQPWLYRWERSLPCGLAHQA